MTAGGEALDRFIVQNNPVNYIDPLGLFDTHQFLNNTAYDASVFSGLSFLIPGGQTASVVFAGIGLGATALDYMLYPSDPVVTSLTTVSKAAMRADPHISMLTDPLID